MMYDYDVRINVAQRMREGKKVTLITFSIIDADRFDLPERATFEAFQSEDGEDERLYIYPSDDGWRLGHSRYQIGVEKMIDIFKPYQGTSCLHFDAEMDMYYISKNEVKYEKIYHNSFNRSYANREFYGRKGRQNKMTEDERFLDDTVLSDTGLKEAISNPADICWNCRHKDVCKYSDILANVKDDLNWSHENPFEILINCMKKEIENE